VCGCRSGYVRADGLRPAPRPVTRCSAIAVVIASLAASGAAHAAKWTATASAGGAETYNHYSGPAQPSDGFVTSLTAALGFQGEGARAKVSGTLSATENFYQGQGQNNSFAPTANVAGHVEAIEKFFFVDATASITQSFISPFGPQPSNITTPTNNRYTSETYSVSPYIQGVIAPNVSYSLRDDNVWTPSSHFGGSSTKTPTTYWNNLNGQLSQEIGYWGWALQYSRQYYDNGVDADKYTVDVGRVIATFRVDPQLSVAARGGYERDRFAVAPPIEGTIYGGGVTWKPTERTLVDGYWEHRFFGSSYSLQASHRLPNVALSANFSRGLSSYPQLALLIPAGVNVAQFLDAAFATRIPDPTERALAVAQFLAQSGLPPTLIAPVNFYSRTLTLQQTEVLSAVWVGALNSVAFTVYRSESEAVTGQGTALPTDLQFGGNNTQTGAGVSYAHRISGLTNLIASVTYSTTSPNNTDATVANVRTHNFNTLVALSTRFSPKTSGSVGVSYFVFETAGSSGANPTTLSVYATISHTF
jgi:uncharacterized protein (PEP-CTERM system associated)